MKFITKLKNFDIDDLLTSPLFLWIFSIILAVSMWIYVTGMDESAFITRKFSVSLEYRGLDAQGVLRNRTSEVDIEIRGPERAMMGLDYNSINAYVDARNLAPGKKYTVNVNVGVPADITLLSCVPSQITLDLVRQVTRLMNVEIILPQNLPEGQYIEGVEIIPKEVAIRGAEDDVAKVGSVNIRPTLQELQSTENLLMPVRFNQSQPFDGNVAIEPAQVRFRGNLVRGLPRKRVPVNVRLTGKLDADYEVRSIITDPSEIQVEGNADELAKIETVDTEYIDVSSMNSDTVVVAPLRMPDIAGISFVNASSVKVSVLLSEARAERMLANIPVELRGAEAGQNWLCSPANVTVTIEGRPSLIESFDVGASGLNAYVDMSNIFMAPVTLPVRTELSADVFRVTRIEPANVTVNNLSAQ
ncbi:MAG: hypothetical protein IJU48_05825 [Synergistaceae bacterium]|nr:hypothetical protein [Synergistaceae bacterium]